MIAARRPTHEPGETGAVAEVLARAAARSGAPEPLPAPPSLRLCVVTCMDARIDPSTLLGLEPGEAHVVRTAGAAATPAVLQALTISQRDGGTREVLVIHHTGCVAMSVMEPGRGPEETVVETVERIRAEESIPHRDRVTGAVLDLATGVLREVPVGDGARPAS